MTMSWAPWRHLGWHFWTKTTGFPLLVLQGLNLWICSFSTPQRWFGGDLVSPVLEIEVLYHASTLTRSFFSLVGFSQQIHQEMERQITDGPIAAELGWISYTSSKGQTAAKPHGLGSKGSLLFDELFPTWRFVSFAEIQLPERCKVVSPTTWQGRETGE